MESGRKGELRRSVMSALAAVLAAAVPSLVVSPALADKPPEGAATATPTTKAPEGARAAEPKRAKKAHAPRKSHAKPEAAAKPEVSARPEEAKPAREAKAAPVALAKKAKKTTAARIAGKGKKTARKGDKEAPGRRCSGTPIELDRGGLETQSLTLLDCHDRPVEASQVALSVLARPWGAQKPDLAALHAAHPRWPEHGARSAHGAHGSPPPPRDGDQLAPGVRMLDKGLLARLGAVSRHFPGRPISLVSGYRPQSRGSLHQSARALDLRVTGVSNEELVAFCKTLPDTGCGYYPNSSFVHVDVRNPGTGSVTWIDASGPGEAPRYVHQWPPQPQDSGVAALPADTEPHDGSADPWAELDQPAAEQAPGRADLRVQNRVP